MPNKERQKVVLGGREFAVMIYDDRKVSHDHYIMREMRRSGVDKVMPNEDEDDTEYMVRVQAHLIDSGRTCNLLAAFLLPKGTTEAGWNSQVSDDIAAHIENCNTQADRDLVVQLSMEQVFGFFARGVERLLSFPIFSADATPEPVAQPEKATT